MALPPAKRIAPSLYDYNVPTYAGCGFTISASEQDIVNRRAYIRHTSWTETLILADYIASIAVDGRIYALCTYRFAYDVVRLIPEDGHNTDMIVRESVAKYAQLDQLKDEEYYQFPNGILLVCKSDGWVLVRLYDNHCTNRKIYHWRPPKNSLLIAKAEHYEIHAHDTVTVISPYDAATILRYNILSRQMSPSTKSWDLRLDRTFAHLCRLASYDNVILSAMAPQRVYCADSQTLMHNIDVDLYRTFIDAVGKGMKQLQCQQCRITVRRNYLPWIYHIMDDSDTLFGIVPRDIRDMVVSYAMPQSVHITVSHADGECINYNEYPLFADGQHTLY